jgi:sugar lactone lactonase YvrE
MRAKSVTEYLGNYVSLDKYMRGAVVAALLMAASQSQSVAQSIINTVAGSGRILTGVGGPAIDVPLGNPRGVAVDSHGNVYAADTMQGVVFKISPNGNATVFAGNGSRGFSGDGGPATAAAFLYPWALAIDAQDNVYISDYHNSRVRMVDAGGIITTVAGGGISYYGTDNVSALSSAVFEPAGLAVDAAGNLYIAESGSCAVQKVTPDGIIHNVAGGQGSGFSGDGGPAIDAALTFPQGLALDAAGNLYIADEGNNRVRKIDGNGIITTVAGNGQVGYSGDGGAAASATLSLPTGVALDRAGNLYIADEFNNSIRKVTPAGIITSVAGESGIYPPFFAGDGGLATAATLDLPYGIAIDPAGDLYVSDANHRRIRRVAAISSIITTVAGDGVSNFAGDGGSATQAALDYPVDVKVDSNGNLFIADSMNHRVRKVTPAGMITTIAGNGTPGFSGDGGTATTAQLDTPVAVAVDASGNVYISDSRNNRVRQVTPNGVISTYAGNGDYGFSGDGGPAASASLEIPNGLATDAPGNLYFADSNSNRVRKVAPAGIISTVAGNGDGGFSGDGGPATSATLNSPRGIAVDGIGNLYIADQNNRRVREVTTNGLISTVASSGGPDAGGPEGVSATQIPMDYPVSVAADGKGNFYVYGDWQIYRVNPQGLITILVGAGDTGNHEGFVGDGGPSVSAHVVNDTDSSPPTMGMALDSSGNLYFADTGNDRIREVTNANGNAQIGLCTPDGYCGAASNTGPDFDLGFYGASAGQDVIISNIGTGNLPWAASSTTSSGGNWLTISPASGTAPSTVTISADPTSLAAGFYYGEVMITSPAASNAPRFIGVSLTVLLPFLSQNSGTGTLVVTEPPDVGWSASSNASWITFPSGASGVGSGTVSYALAANVGGTPPYRTATLTIAGQPLNVYQGTGPVSQVITFGTLGNVIYGAAPFTISATASSGLLVSFASTTTAVCTLSGSIVTIVAEGTCSITATQAGNANYAPASPVTQSFKVSTILSLPIVSGVSPGSGSGLSQTFTFTFSDAAGWQSLGVQDILINSALDGRHACYIAYVPSGATTGSLYLVDDAGDAGGPYAGMVLPSSQTASNSQCTVNGTGSSASGSGNTLTLTLAITFSSSFAGNKIFYLASADTGTGNSGWQTPGTWTVPGPPPTGPAVGGVSPARSTTLSQTYTFTFTDTNSWQDLAVLNILINTAIDGRHACYMAYVPSGANAGSLFLVDDPGDGGGPYTGFVLPGSGTAQNSQCTVGGAGSAVTATGNTLTLTLPITFNPSFAGNQVFFLAATSNTVSSGWQAGGSVTVP